MEKVTTAKPAKRSWRLVESVDDPRGPAARLRKPQAAAWRRNAITLVSSGSLSILPVELFERNVLEFLAPVPQHDQLHGTGFYVLGYVGNLYNLRFVNRQWYQISKKLVTEYKKMQCRVVFEEGTNKEYAKATRRLKKERAQAIQLNLAVYGSDQDLPPDEYSPPPAFMRTISWEPIIAAFPNVVRLELNNMCISLIDNILPVAAVACPKLKVLVLPADGPNRYFEDEGDDSHLRSSDSVRVTEVLATALKMWYESNGGLEALYFSIWPKHQLHKYNELLTAVTNYCPNIRILRGEYHVPGSLAARGESNAGFGHSIAFADVSESVWASFCATCTQLQDFTWINAPLTAEFVRHFAATKKPRLRKLVIYTTKFGDEAPVDDMMTIQTMFHALPSLKKLIVMVDTATGSTDEFVQTAIHECPQLERVFFSSCIKISPDTFSEMTDAGLSTLCSGHNMADLQADVRCNGDSLVNSVASLIGRDAAPRRDLFINSTIVPYRAILRLLRYLEQLEPAALQYTRYKLYVAAPFGESREASDDAAVILSELPTELEMRALYDGIKTRHATTIRYMTVLLSRHESEDGRSLVRPTAIYMRINVPSHPLHPKIAPDSLRFEIDKYPGLPMLQGIMF